MTPPTKPRRSVAELVEERDFLLASIEDLEREHAAGDVDDVDFAVLRAGYVERAATAMRDLAAVEGVAPGSEEPDPVARAAGPARGATRTASTRTRRLRRYLGRRRSRRLLVLVGLVCSLGIVLVTAAHMAGVRLPGESATGSVTLSSAAQVRQELEQASILASEGHLREAISTYDTILATAPRQAEALAYKGWFVRLVGIADRDPTVVGDGDALIGRAVRVAPGYAEARAFDAIALDEDARDGRAAVVELRAMLADHPSTALLASVAKQAAAVFAREGEKVPAELARYVRRDAAQPSS